MAVTAITGDIGSGKSTAARLLAGILGCECLDADGIAKRMWLREDVKACAVRRWGSEILDPSGGIVLSRIAEHIFSSKSESDFCNGLIHPLVMAELQDITRNMSTLHDKTHNVSELQDTHDITHNVSELQKCTQNLSDKVVEIPLLPEAGRPAWIDRAIYITAKFETRAERCKSQRGWSVDELMRRESLLLPQRERVAVCEYVIHNDGGVSELERLLAEIT